MSNQKIKEWLENEKWYPLIKPTNDEMRVAELLNNILDDIISRIPDEKCEHNHNKQGICILCGDKINTIIMK